MEDGRDTNIFYDEYGNRYSLDINGAKIPCAQSEVINTHSGWKEYDSSQGHCGLCGSLYCRGTCCK